MRKPDVSTGTKEPARMEVRRGVMMGAAMVETVVMSTERATSALATRVTRLLAVPSEHAGTWMRPTAKAGDRPKSFAMDQPSEGMMVNWHMKPRKTCLGLCMTRWKSFTSRVIPMKSIVNACPGL